MQFGLLGPVEVEEEGRFIALGSAKQRALLAILLLHANEVVSRDRLIDDLWGERPPESASHSLEVYVSRLRKALQPDGGEPLLLTRPGGYLLRLGPEQLDLSRFERLSEDGRGALAVGNYDTAAARLREALALWRGSALADLAYEPFARPEADRLEEQRLAALEDKLEAELALGRHVALVGELELLSREHPLRERFRGQLMLALYRCGRQAEALETYRKTRQQLVDEVGIDPSPALQRLEQAILRQDPALELPGQSLTSEDGEPPIEPLTYKRRLLSIKDWRPAGLVVAVTGLLVAVVAGTVLLLTGGSVRSLDRVDANAVGIVDPHGGRIREELLLHAAPAQVATGAGSVWAVSPNSQTVSRIDPVSPNVTQTIDVGEGPGGIAFGGDAVWVANSLDGTVSRIDPGTNRVVDRIPVGNVPTAVAVGFGSIWITNAGDQSVTRLDAKTGRPLATIPTGDLGRGITVGGGAVWVSDDTSGRVSRIDPHSNEVSDQIGVGNGAGDLTYGAGAVWVANGLDGTVSRIDPATNVATTVQVGGNPSHLTIAGDEIWVSDEFGGKIFRIDARRNRVVASVKTGNRTEGITLAAGRIWVAVQAAGRPHRGGTLRIISTGFLGPLDPNGDYSIWNLLIATNDGLTAFKRVGGVEGSELVPDLATSLPKPSNGGRTYVFRLRPGIRYSNGRVVRPADFRYSLERLFALHSVGTYLYAGIVGAAGCNRRPLRCDLSRGIVADNGAGTVTFRLIAPDPDFPAKLALPFATAVPVGTPKRKEIVPATGPYVIASYAPKRQLELQRNPHFHEWSRAAQPDGYPDEINWRFVVKDQPKVTAVERGEADWLNDIPPRNRLAELRTQYASQLHTSFSSVTQYLFLNTRSAPFNDVRVRKALNYAIDRNVVARLWGGPELARPTCQVLPPSFPGYRRYCPYTRRATAAGAWSGPDLAKARRLVAASHTKGTRVTVWSFSQPPWVDIARYTAALLHRLGYRTTVKGIAPVDFWQEAADSRNKAQIGLVAWGADYARASNFFTPNLTCRSFQPHSPSNLNVARFCDHKIDAEIKNALAQQLTNPEGTSGLWAEIDRAVVDKAPWVPLYTPAQPDFLSKRTGNYQVSPQWGVLIDQLWVR
jgi:YVTN family beta-propeller protein